MLLKIGREKVSENESGNASLNYDNYKNTTELREFKNMVSKAEVVAQNLTADVSGKQAHG